MRALRQGGAQSRWPDGRNPPHNTSVSFPEQDKRDYATEAAANIQNPISGRNASAKKLVEEVDIDVTELLMQVGHVKKWRINRCLSGFNRGWRHPPINFNRGVTNCD